MKPIIIAGNGPSLAQIDYSRLPKDFDVFRCNQFYFEDRYFLGKKIKGVFFNPEIFKEQCFTLRHLKERGEYEVEDVYCARAFDDRYYEMDFFFPFVKNTFEALQSLPDFLELDRFYRCYYRKWPTAGIVMLYTALAQGYKEIYLVGIDFYESGQTDYAFEIKNKNIGKIIPNFNKEEISQPHTKEVDLSFIQLAQKMDGITLYSLSPSSPMSKFIPLAPPPIEKTSFDVLEKPQGYICDLVELPQLETDSKSIRVRIKNILHQNHIESIRENIFYIFARDFWFCCRASFVLLKNIFKILK